LHNGSQRAGVLRITRSGDLLRSLVAGGEVTQAQISSELSLSSSECAALLSGARVMSLAHQLVLAAVCIERVPRLARRGYTLRSQALAAMAFAQGVTAVHGSTPAKWTNLKGGRAR